MYLGMLTFHVLGATIWAGGHLVLAITVLPRALRAHDPDIVSSFESGFERLGIPALLVQIVTGLWLAQRLVPPGEWLAFDNPLAAHVGTKVVLLILTIILAAHARLRIIPRLDATRLPMLSAHIIAVTVLAVLMVVMGVGMRTGGFM